MPIAEHFAVKMSGELGLELFAGFSTEARDTLMEYHWPGNVRELKNVVERAVYSALGSSEPITSINFDPFDSPWRPNSNLVTQENNEISNSVGEIPSIAYDFKSHIQQVEITLLQNALEQSRFNQKNTAEFLGMTYHQLRGYLRKYDLTDQED